MKIPLFKPHIDKACLRSVAAVFRRGKLSRGIEVERFEKSFAQFVGKKYAVALNSGTSALHVTVRVLGWKPGDEIITTPFSYIASGNAILLEGATPVFVDIDPDTLNIDIERIEAKITPKTKGILLVHALGLPVAAEPVRRLASKYNLQVIEDACEALAQSDDQFDVGKVGDLVVYGFHENKQLTTAGEGGMVVTDDADLARRVWSMRDQGRATGLDWIHKVTLGFNFRMTEIQAAYGTASLKSLERQLLKREQLAETYHSVLKNIPGISLPQGLFPDRRSWFVYFILCQDEHARLKIHQALTDADIASSTNYFPPIYKFPMYDKFRAESFPVTESVSERLLALPMFVDLKVADIKRISKIIECAICPDHQ